MTGEISLRGLVLPIGGLREKLLAAKRGGFKTVLIPKGNVPELKDFPEEVTQGITITGITVLGEAMEMALMEEEKEK
jgi:ATP-dependent Lon protease